MKGILNYTFEYDGRGDDPGFVELQIHYNFTPGTPGTGRGVSLENYDPGSGHEVDYDHAERDVGLGGQTIWQRLMPGEWLDGQCRNYLETREEDDLIEGLPNGGERDPDDDRDDRIDRELMERHRPNDEGDRY